MSAKHFFFISFYKSVSDFQVQYGAIIQGHTDRRTNGLTDGHQTNIQTDGQVVQSTYKRIIYMEGTQKIFYLVVAPLRWGVGG